MMTNLRNQGIIDNIGIRVEGGPVGIKTVYGEMEYSRRVYQATLEDGRKAYVYLLDQAMQ